MPSVSAASRQVLISSHGADLWFAVTAFQKPRGKVDYPELGLEAAVKALLDAGINYDDIEQAYVGYCCMYSHVDFCFRN